MKLVVSPVWSSPAGLADGHWLITWIFRSRPSSTFVDIDLRRVHRGESFPLGGMVISSFAFSADIIFSIEAECGRKCPPCLLFWNIHSSLL